MEATVNNQTDNERIINETKKRLYEEAFLSKTNTKIDKEEKAERIVYRGRDDYSMKGVLRTKPGRIDSDPTRSLSCRYISIISRKSPTCTHPFSTTKATKL